MAVDRFMEADDRIVRTRTPWENLHKPTRLSLSRVVGVWGRGSLAPRPGTHGYSEFGKKKKKVLGSWTYYGYRHGAE